MSQTIYLCFRTPATDDQEAGPWLKLVPIKPSSKAGLGEELARVKATHGDKYEWRYFTRSQWDRHLAGNGWRRRRHKR